MTLRKHLQDLVSRQPRSVSSLARELGMSRGVIPAVAKRRAAHFTGGHVLAVFAFRPAISAPSVHVHAALRPYNPP